MLNEDVIKFYLKQTGLQINRNQREQAVLGSDESSSDKSPSQGERRFFFIYNYQFQSLKCQEMKKIEIQIASQFQEDHINKD